MLWRVHQSHITVAMPMHIYISPYCPQWGIGPQQCLFSTGSCLSQLPVPLPMTNPSHSRDGFPLGAVILPSSGAWLEISIGLCGFEFIVAVSVT